MEESKNEKGHQHTNLVSETMCEGERGRRCAGVCVCEVSVRMECVRVFRAAAGSGTASQHPRQHTRVLGAPGRPSEGETKSKQRGESKLAPLATCGSPIREAGENNRHYPIHCN